MKEYFNIKNFDSVQLKSDDDRAIWLKEKWSKDSKGRQEYYDIFLSHSCNDKDLVKRIRGYIENNLGFSVYIDWEEDKGTPRNKIADAVKKAMDISDSFLVLKTKNSDESSWVPWEVGYYDNIDFKRIGVLLIEEEDYTEKTFDHQEFYKQYALLAGEADIKRFIEGGSEGVRDYYEGHEKIISSGALGSFGFYGKKQ